MAMTLIVLIAACDESKCRRMDAHTFDDRNFSGRPLSATHSSTVHPTNLLLSQRCSRALVQVPRTPRTGTFASLTNRDFALFLGGLLVTGTGGWVQRIA